MAEIEIRIAKSAGFCFGVERIVALAEALLAEAQGRDQTVYCLGELIHNPQEVERLRAAGLRYIRSPQELPHADGRGGRVLIRAHGVSPQVKQQIRARGYTVVDGTCPLVNIPHRFARQIVEDGYRLVIMGHREHPEIVGILGEVEGSGGRARVDVIPGPEAVADLGLSPSDRVGLISQTTHPYERFAELVTAVLERALEVRAYNTICQATLDRQVAIRELAEECDLVIVIGGRQSSNTNRLAEIARRLTRCYHIEDASELKGAWFDGVKRVGISAGASTPRRAIEAVVQQIKRQVKRVRLYDGQRDPRQ